MMRNCHPSSMAASIIAAQSDIGNEIHTPYAPKVRGTK